MYWQWVCFDQLCVKGLKATLSFSVKILTKFFSSSSFIGIEGSFWGETVRTADQMYSMLFPRLLALAERAWHKASWENVSNPDESNRERTGDWVKFANTVAYRELGRLGKMGVSYHVAPPGARLVLRKRLDVDLQISHIHLNFFFSLYSSAE